MVALGAALGRSGLAASELGAGTPIGALTEAVHRCRPSVVVVYAHLPKFADTTVFGRMPSSTTPIAAGPGWQPALLPAGMEHVNSLATATAAADRSARRT